MDYLASQPKNLVQLLQGIQESFPITAKPFDELADRYGTTPPAAKHFLEDMTNHKIIRQVGPVFEARKLGYVSTLIAASVPQPMIEDFIQHVNGHPGVSHNYGRDHHFNIWLTLTAPTDQLITDFVEEARKQFNLTELYSLPASRLFKLQVVFNLDGSETSSVQQSYRGSDWDKKPAQPGAFNDAQKQLVRSLQEGLRWVERPFELAGRASGLSEDQVISQILTWQEQGIIRRFSARFRHEQLGFVQNAMVVFQVDPDQIEAAGEKLARFSEISHCYQRQVCPGWFYNLFAMIHCRTPEELRDRIKQMVDQINPRQYDMLKSVCEYKKEPVKYFV